MGVGVEVESTVAELQAMLAGCRDRNERLAAENRRMRSYIGWVNGVLRNQDMSAGDKVILLATRGECEQVAARTGVDVTEPVPIFQQNVAKRAGCSPQAVGDRHKALARVEALRIEPKTERVGPGGAPRTRNHIALTPAALNAPAQLAYAPDDELKPNRGGKRVPITCMNPECHSTRLREEIRRRIVCEECGTVQDQEPVIRMLNEEEEEDTENKNAPLAPTPNPSPARQLDMHAQTPKSDPDPRFVGQPWYDPAEPDGSLSQGLAWACLYDKAQATFWYGSERLRDRWQRNKPIVTLVSSGPLTPMLFPGWLYVTYGERDLGKLRMVAQVLGLDPERVALPRIEELDDEEGASDEQAQ